MKITTLEMEIILAERFNSRANLIVPNVSWGMDSHECDLFILTPAGYATEVEIKVTKADLRKDKLKKHGHFNPHIKYLYFAIPEYLRNDIEEIPEEAGIYIAERYNGRWWCYMHRQALKKSKYKYSDAERLKLARLGAMRIWGLKRKVEKLKRIKIK